MSKDEWAEAAIQGDEAALLQRIELDKRQWYAIAYSYMRNETDALEAIQETVCRIWIKIRTLREPRFFTTWSIKILIRVCMDTKRKQKRECPTKVIATHDEINTVGSESAIAAERLDMAAQVKLLPANYRMVITLKYYRDMTITEIAMLLEKPDGTVRTWLNKALKLLRMDMSAAKEELWDEQTNGHNAGATPFHTTK